MLLNVVLRAIAVRDPLPVGDGHRRPARLRFWATRAKAAMRHRPSIHVEPRGAKATARHYIRDLVYGANDGVITTFAVVAGVAGGQLSATAALVVGAANLAADGLS